MGSRSSHRRGVSSQERHRGASRQRSYINSPYRQRESFTYVRESMDGRSAPFHYRDSSVSPARSTYSRNTTPAHCPTPVSNSMSTTAPCKYEDDIREDFHNADRFKPRDFRNILTCFFWYNAGRCNKPAEKCIYAHYNTGVIAEPPVSYKGQVLGGIRAKKVLGSIAQREEDMDAHAGEAQDTEQRLAIQEATLREREAAIAVREQNVRQREDAVYERETAFAEFEEGMLRKLEEHYHEVASTVQQIRRGVGNAQRTLSHRRVQVLHYENSSDSLQGTHGLGRYGGSIAIDGAIGAMAGLDQVLAESEVRITSQIHNAIKN